MLQEALKKYQGVSYNTGNWDGNNEEITGTCQAHAARTAVFSRCMRCHGATAGAWTVLVRLSNRRRLFLDFLHIGVDTRAERLFRCRNRQNQRPTPSHTIQRRNALGSVVVRAVSAGRRACAEQPDRIDGAGVFGGSVGCGVSL